MTEPEAELAEAAPAMRPPAHPDVDVATAAEAFLADLRIGKSRWTVSTYRAALRRFLEGLAPERIEPKSARKRGVECAPAAPPLPPVSALTEDHAIEFARQLGDVPGLPKATLMTYTTAVVRFYAFLLREDYRADLPLPRIAERLKAIRGKRPRALPRVPDDAVVNAIIDAARNRPPAGDARLECLRLRDIAIVECLRGSGMRVSELVGLRRGDLARAQQAGRVTGKGDKMRMVYFTPAAWRSLDVYFAARHAIASGRSIALQPVFARHDPGTGKRLLPLSTKSVRQIVQGLADAAGQADAGVTPHRFRAWFATHMVEETGDLAATQDLLGHASADTTRVYTRVASARLRALHRQAFEGEG